MAGTSNCVFCLRQSRVTARDQSLRLSQELYGPRDQWLKGEREMSLRWRVMLLVNSRSNYLVVRGKTGCHRRQKRQDLRAWRNGGHTSPPPANGCQGPT